MNCVQPIPGERCRFRVASDRRGVPAYLVDLLSLDRNGECDCPNFRMRLKPRVEDGETARCKHIQRARSYFLDELLKAISAASGERRSDG